MSDPIVVRDQEQEIAFSFEDMMRYHGPGSPGGVAHAYKVLERALPLLEPGGIPQRREIIVRTAFGGPGARDAFELVTRAVTEDRYVVDPLIERAERGRARARFVFRLSYRDQTVTLTVREGYVTDEFIDLARTQNRNPAEESRLTALKQEMASLVMSAPAGDVYDVLGSEG
jgi:GrpB-like predicted nucleotidyltransferase (UPF0157 family)